MKPDKFKSLIAAGLLGRGSYRTLTEKQFQAEQKHKGFIVNQRGHIFLLRRTFQAAKFLKDSQERTALNGDTLTSGIYADSAVSCAVSGFDERWKAKSGPMLARQDF